ncbi:MAG TPA: hypothetical protein VMV06_04650 [Acidimicrobiales bacterium]|nr:hypothetical protein [Acidimicrobiales bacterium]
MANTPVALVVNNARRAFPLSESSLTLGAAITIGKESNQVNAVRISPDGLTAVIAEYTASRVQDLTWSGTAWALAKTLPATRPTAVAIDPVPNASGSYVAYVVSYYRCGDVQVLDTASNLVTTINGVGSTPTMVTIPPVPLWYESTATHGLWNSNPSTPSSFAAGWNPGEWQ